MGLNKELYFVLIECLTCDDLDAVFLLMEKSLRFQDGIRNLDTPNPNIKALLRAKHKAEQFDKNKLFTCSCKMNCFKPGVINTLLK